MKIVIICQWFPPEDTPVAVMLKELADDLIGKGHKVTIVTGFPNHPQGVLFPGFKKKIFNVVNDADITLIRCYLYTSPKKTFLRRLFNYLTFALFSFVAVMRLERQDVLFVVSPPITNGLIAMVIKKLRGLNFVFNIQDIYPDAAISAQVIKNRFIVKALQKMELSIYNAASRISVISEGFRQNLISKGVPIEKVEVLFNWLDVDEIIPLPKDNDFSREHGLTNKFVVLYSGTVGLISGAEILLECASKLAPFNDILFLFVGEGVVKERLMEAVAMRQLSNVRFLPFQRRAILSQVQSCSNISIVTLSRKMGKSSVPSKVLGYLAAARPVIASVDVDSDTGRMISDANCGICTDPKDADGLTAAILELYHDPERAQRLGANGRNFLENFFDRKRITVQYERLFIDCTRLFKWPD